MRVFILVLTLSLLTLNHSSASVTIVPLSNKDKTANDFPFVGSVRNINNNASGSGTVVGDGHFVITAKHMITHDNEDSGMVLDACNFVFIIDNRIHNIIKVYGNDKGDIAILELEDTCDYSANFYDGDSFVFKEFYGVGLGRSSSSASFDKIEWDIPYGTKRVYKNRFTEVISAIFVNNNSKISLGYLLKFDVDDPSSSLTVSGEGIHGPGDSGGGCFIEQDNKLKLMGIISSLTTSTPYYGFIVRISDYRGWIEDIIYAKKRSENRELPFNKSDNKTWAIMNRRQRRLVLKIFRHPLV